MTIHDVNLIVQDCDPKSKNARRFSQNCHALCSWCEHKRLHRSGISTSNTQWSEDTCTILGCHKLSHCDSYFRQAAFGGHQCRILVPVPRISTFPECMHSSSDQHWRGMIIILDTLLNIVFPVLNACMIWEMLCQLAVQTNNCYTRKKGTGCNKMIPCSRNLQEVHPSFLIRGFKIWITKSQMVGWNYISSLC